MHQRGQMNSDREEMLVLLRRYYPEGKTQSSIPDFWQLADTASRPPTPEMYDPGGLEYPWQLEKCSVCGKLGCVMFSQATGYRCEDPGCRTRS